MAYESVDSGSALLTDESQKVTVQLQNGTAVIPQGADIETAKAAIAKALVVNADEVDVKNLDWEYECEGCLLYTSPSPRDGLLSRMPSSA